MIELIAASRHRFEVLRRCSHHPESTLNPQVLNLTLDVDRAHESPNPEGRTRAGSHDTSAHR